MPKGIIGKGLSNRVDALEDNRASGRVSTVVTGTSMGFGGTEDAIFVPTSFIVKHAIANLSKEYDLKDASRLFNFNDDAYIGEIRVRLPDSGTGFYVDFFQADLNESWELNFNWFARG